MTEEDIPTAVWSGTFTVFGVELKCHVLNNGQRIIETESVAALLEAMGEPVDSNDLETMDDLKKFVRWQRGK